MKHLICPHDSWARPIRTTNHTMATLDPLQTAEFADNPSPRCACVVLVDTSGSMQGEKIDRLNEGLQTLKSELCKDAQAADRVEIAVVTFDSEVKVVQDFATPEALTITALSATGLTHMGSGILKALDMVEKRKQIYKQAGIPYYRPWVFMITDGEPQGEGDGVIQSAARAVRSAEENKKAMFFAVGVQGANLLQLAQISPPNRPPLMLQGLNFRELFLWLSQSQAQVANSNTSDQVALPPPTGWASVGP